MNNTLERKEAKKEEKVEQEPAVVKKRKRDAMDSLVGDIISTASRSNMPREREASRTASAGPEPKEVKPEVDVDVDVPPPPQVEQGRREPERKPSLLHRTRTSAFEDPRPLDRPLADRKPTSSFPPTALGPTTSSSATLPLPPEIMGDGDVNVKMEADDLEVNDKFFSGLRFSHVIEEKCKGLEVALVAHGGVFIPDKERQAGAEVDYIVVRL